MDTVDFHAHILPGADHGSSSMDMTLKQLNLAKARGVKRIIATPHFYPHRENVDSFIERRNICYEELTQCDLSEYPEIILGAEVLICDGIEKMPMLDRLCISGTKVLLIELPFTDFSDNYVISVKHLINQGYTVILAHIDRYAPDNIDKLLRVGAYAQINADALSGPFVRSRIKRWIEEGNVRALGSDIHRIDKKAYARFSKSVKKLGKIAAEFNNYVDTIWSQAKKQEL